MRGNFKPDPQARPGVYRLMFVDDNGQVHEVQKEFVVAVSVPCPFTCPSIQDNLY